MPVLYAPPSGPASELRNQGDITVLSVPNIVTLVFVSVLFVGFAVWAMRLPERVRSCLYRQKRREVLVVQREEKPLPRTPRTRVVSVPMSPPCGSLYGHWPDSTPLENTPERRESDISGSGSGYQFAALSPYNTHDNVALLPAPEIAYIAPQKKRFYGFISKSFFGSSQKARTPKTPRSQQHSATSTPMPYEKLQTPA